MHTLTTKDEPSMPQLTTSWYCPSSSILRARRWPRQSVSRARPDIWERDALVQLLDKLACAALGRLCCAARLTRAASRTRRIAARLVVVIVVCVRALALHLCSLALAGTGAVKVLLLLLLARVRLLLLCRGQAVRVLLRVTWVLVVLRVRVLVTVGLHRCAGLTSVTRDGRRREVVGRWGGAAGERRTEGASR